jgi:Holliday junction resolvase RusA-like endonuclease
MINARAKIVVTSYRHRLVDVDGISIKAAIDGLVHAGVLVDDGPEYVREVVLRQRKASKERTVIKITWS